MPLDRGTDPLGDDQPNARVLPRFVVAAATNMHDNVTLNGTHAVFHRRVKLSGPPHAVARG